MSEKGAGQSSIWGREGGLVPSLYLVLPHWLLPSLGHLMSEKQFERWVATAIDVLIMGRLLLLSVSLPQTADNLEMDFTKVAGQILRGKVSRPVSRPPVCIIFYTLRTLSVTWKQAVNSTSCRHRNNWNLALVLFFHTDFASCMQILLLPELNPPLRAGLFFLPKFVMWLKWWSSMRWFSQIWLHTYGTTS
jgi:hypothetical protein